MVCKQISQDEMVKFIETPKLLKLTEEEVGIFIRPKMSKEIKIVI